MNVWAAFHSARRSFSDVAVASSRADDPREWHHAAYLALRQAREYELEMIRWKDIAEGLMSTAQAVEEERRGSA
jgi:hypothetical protein